MPLFSIIGGLTLLACVAIWATVRLTTLSLQSESQTPLQVIGRVWQTFAVVVGVVFVLETWPGLAAWTSDVVGAVL